MMLMVLPLVALGFVATASAPAPDSAARDRDRDRLPDEWERRYDLSTSKQSAKGDPDRDGLRNLREHRLRTNPRKRDTDGDGYGDRAELRAGTNPRDRASRPGAARKGYQFPNRETTGVPDGWAPRQTRADDLTVTRPGTVVQDIRFTNGADVIVKARDVTIRRVDMQGGMVTNQSGSTCGTGLLVEDSTFEPAAGQPYVGDDLPAIGEGGYDARRVEIWKRGEGFRASDCGPVRVTDSFAYIQGDTRDCGRDLHSDGVQGYYAKGMTLRNATIIFGNDCGTSPYFIGYGPGYPSEPPINTGTYVVDRLLVAGGGYVFRQGVPASVTGLRIVDKSWVYGPIDNACSDISPWEAKLVRVDSRYRITRVVRNQRCMTNTRN